MPKDFLEIIHAENYLCISKCEGVRWPEKMEYVALLPVYGPQPPCGRTLEASVGTYFMADVERDRESPGDSGNRGNLFRLQPPLEVTSWAIPMCHMDEWGASSETRHKVGPCPGTVASQP